MVQPWIVRGGATGGRFIWNLTDNVGAKQPNRTDDVQLVQFAYSFVSKSSAVSAELRAAAALVKPGAPFSGDESDPLMKAIRTQEGRRGGPQDGRVSKFSSDSGIYHFGRDDKAFSFILMMLNNHLSDNTKDYFPRIDKHSACPPDLKTAVIAACPLP